MPITGLDEAGREDGIVVFHSGTRRRADGRFESAGGRVLGVTARAPTLAAARLRAYAACDRIHFDAMQLRRDIAAAAALR
jgi:phosphoribosylamine--glycine ligase